MRVAKAFIIPDHCIKLPAVKQRHCGLTRNRNLAAELLQGPLFKMVLAQIPIVGLIHKVKPFADVLVIFAKLPCEEICRL